MRLRLLFAVLVCALTVSVFAQTTNATGTVVSATANTLVGTTVGDFTIGLDGGKINGTNRKMGSVQVEFTIDTNYVDLIFGQYNLDTGEVTEVALSSLTASSNALVANNMLTVDGAMVVKGSPGGTATNLGGGRYLVDLGIVGGATADNAPLGRNPWLTGDPNAPVTIKYVMKNAAISTLVGRQYNVAIAAGNPVNQTTYFRTGKTTTTAVAFNVAGGTFKCVPEPSSIFAILAGVGGLISIRRRK